MCKMQLRETFSVLYFQTKLLSTWQNFIKSAFCRFLSAVFYRLNENDRNGCDSQAMIIEFKSSIKWDDIIFTINSADFILLKVNCIFPRTKTWTTLKKSSF